MVVDRLAHVVANQTNAAHWFRGPGRQFWYRRDDVFRHAEFLCLEHAVTTRDFFPGIDAEKDVSRS